MNVNLEPYSYRVSLKKGTFVIFLSYFSSRGRILLFHMCFGIKISNPFHLAIQKVSIQNLNCPKNACADMIFIPALRSEDWAGIKIMSAHAFLAFLGQLRFWMDTFWIARWNGLKILIPKHMWKTKIELQEQIWGQNPYDTFFLGHPVVSYHRLQQFKWALLTSSGRGLFRWVLSWSTFFILVHLYIQLVGGSCEETWGEGGED